MSTEPPDDETIEQTLRKLIALGHIEEHPTRPGAFRLTDAGRKHVESKLLPPELKPS